MDIRQQILDSNAAMEQAADKAQQVQLQKDLARYIVAELKQIALTVATHMSDNVGKVTVENLKDTIEVPSIKQVITELQALNKSNLTIGTLVTLTEKFITIAEQLPKVFPEFPSFPDKIEVTNQIDTTAELAAIKSSIEKLKLSPVFDPKITVTPSEVKVVSDFAPVLSKMEEQIQAFNRLADKEYPVFDTNPIIEGLATFTTELSKNIKSIKMPSSSQGPSFKDTDGGQARATVVTVNGQNAVLTSDITMAVRLDDTSTANNIYIGKAPVGSATSASVWQISKLDTSSGLTKTWAGSAGFTQIWDNRTSLTYI